MIPKRSNAGTTTGGTNQLILPPIGPCACLCIPPSVNVAQANPITGPTKAAILRQNIPTMIADTKANAVKRPSTCSVAVAVAIMSAPGEGHP